MVEQKKLLKPSKIREMIFKNRLVMAPMATNFVTNDSGVNGRMLDYYREREQRVELGLLLLNAYKCMNIVNIYKVFHLSGIIYYEWLEDLINSVIRGYWIKKDPI